MTIVEQEQPTLPEIRGFLWDSCCSVFWVRFCRSFCFLSFGHCIVCPSSIYGFWLAYPFGISKLFAIVCSVLLRFTASDFPLVSPSFSPLHCMSFFDLRPLISLPLWYLQAFRHCIVSPSSIYGFRFGIFRPFLHFYN